MGDFPLFVSFGEALTDLIRRDGNAWTSIPGGAPWNVARVMACFGVSSAFGGAISRDCFGDELWQSSESAGLDMRFLQRTPQSPLLAIVHETHPPRYFFLGDDSADLHFDISALPTGWESAVRWAHFGSISLAREPLAGRLVSLAEQLHEHGVRICYDPNFRALMDARYDPVLMRMMAVADLVKVSDEDLCGLFRTADEEAGFARLRGMNPNVPILYTRGGEGAALYVGERVWRAVPPDIEVVDTVGAGDCSLAGFLSSLLHYPDSGWDAHLRASVAAGTGACLAAGATPPSDELQKRLVAGVRVSEG